MSTRNPLRDSLRLALGTLTVLPTRAPEVVDRRVASWAMTLAPLVGAALAVLAGALLWLLGASGAGLPQVTDLLPPSLAATWAVSPTLAAALAVGLLALLTRAMHLDGLADTADGLGSGRSPDRALEVMRRGDVGPFGVVALVLVLVVQVLALGDLIASDVGAGGLFLALVVSRLALPLVCSRGVQAARTDGLGHVVAGSVGRGQLLLAATATLVLASAGLALPGGLDLAAAERLVVVAGAGLASAAYLARHAVRRLGGVTGDVLGAATEAAFTASLVTAALLT